MLLSGGDPFLLSDEKIGHILDRIRREVPSVEVIRFGTRIPVTMPQRITPELVEGAAAPPPGLRQHPLFGAAGGITPESEKALALMADAGIPLGNQTDAPARGQ